MQTKRLSSEEAYAVATVRQATLGADQLSALLMTRALIEEVQHRGGLMASREHPGYLVLEVGDETIYIPFNIAQGFPEGEVVGYLRALARFVQCDPISGRICVSGSSTFLRDLQSISDIDLCEYVEHGSVSVGTLQSLSTLQEPSLFIAKCDEDRCYAPAFENMTELARNFANPSAVGETKRLKMDFIACDGPFGVIPVTNMILPIPMDDIEGGAANQSFAYQEAVLARSGQAPRVLIKASTLRAYMDFLRSDIASKLKIDPAKALKRAISLARLVGFPSDLSAALEVVNSPLYGALMQKKRWDEVEYLAGAAGARGAKFKMLVDQEQALASTKLTPQLEVAARALAAVQAVALLDQLNAVFDLAQALPQ